MTKKHGMIAVHISDRTVGMWASFRERARSLGLSDARAMERAAELWLASIHPDPWSAPLPAPTHVDKVGDEWINVFSSGEVDD